MADLTQDEWVRRLELDKNAVILDVRTDAEVEEGHIPGSIHIDFYRGQGFLEEIDKLDKAKNYYIYCRSGNRAGQAIDIMKQAGFTGELVNGGSLENAANQTGLTVVK